MRNLSSCLLVFLIVACSGEAPNDTEIVAEEPAVEQSVVAFFALLGDLDLESAQGAITPDFEMVQDTVVFDWASFVDYARPFMDAGATVSYEFSEFNTKVRGPVAWTRYRSRSVFQIDGQTTRSEWLESAILERVGDGWKINRLQSTPIWIEPEEG